MRVTVPETHTDSVQAAQLETGVDPAHLLAAAWQYINDDPDARSQVLQIAAKLRQDAQERRITRIRHTTQRRRAT